MLKDLQSLEGYYYEFVPKDAMDIEKLTGCKKPCKFHTYETIYEYQAPNDEMEKRDEIWIDVTLASAKMTVKTETLLYPLRSFIAEAGGALGLFLGFSFVMVVDGFEKMILFVKQYMEKIKF